MLNKKKRFQDFVTVTDTIDIFYPIIYFKWVEYASDYAKSE